MTQIKNKFLVLFLIAESEFNIQNIKNRNIEV